MWTVFCVGCLFPPISTAADTRHYHKAQGRVWLKHKAYISLISENNVLSTENMKRSFYVPLGTASRLNRRAFVWLFGQYVGAGTNTSNSCQITTIISYELNEQATAVLQSQQANNDQIILLKASKTLCFWLISQIEMLEVFPIQQPLWLSLPQWNEANLNNKRSISSSF